MLQIAHSQPIPKPQSFLDRQQTGSSLAKGLANIADYIVRKSMERNIDNTLQSKENEIRSELDSGASVVVYEVREYKTADGYPLVTGPYRVGSGKNFSEVIGKDFFGKDRLYPSFGRAYKWSESYFYSFTKTPSGSIVRSDKQRIYGSPDGWQTYSDQAAVARSSFEQAVEAERKAAAEAAKQTSPTAPSASPPKSPPNSSTKNDNKPDLHLPDPSIERPSPPDSGDDPIPEPENPAPDPGVDSDPGSTPPENGPPIIIP